MLHWGNNYVHLLSLGRDGSHVAPEGGALSFVDGVNFNHLRLSGGGGIFCGGPLWFSLNSKDGRT